MGGWYEGTADAVRRNLRHLLEADYSEVLILSGDQLYRMDFRRLIKRHRMSQADVTIAVLPVPRDQVSSFGIVRVDESGRVNGFVENLTAETVAPRSRPPAGFIQGQGYRFASGHISPAWAFISSTATCW